MCDNNVERSCLVILVNFVRFFRGFAVFLSSPFENLSPAVPNFPLGRGVWDAYQMLIEGVAIKYIIFKR